jgi:hypothetical protein
VLLAGLIDNLAGAVIGFEAATGPFSPSIEAEAWDYRRFLDALDRLHETLVG